MADLAARYPQTFVLEKYRPHWPLKVGTAATSWSAARSLTTATVSVALIVYTRRVMYLRSLVAGAARVDLDGNPAGEESAPGSIQTSARK